MKSNTITMCKGHEEILTENFLTTFNCPLVDFCLRRELKEIIGVDYFVRLPYDKSFGICRHLIKKTEK